MMTPVQLESSNGKAIGETTGMATPPEIGDSIDIDGRPHVVTARRHVQLATWDARRAWGLVITVRPAAQQHRSLFAEKT
jgi:hypothetical protein